MSRNLPTLNLLITVAMVVMGIMTDKSLYLLFVSISICQVSEHVKVGKIYTKLWMWIAKCYIPSVMLFCLEKYKLLIFEKPRKMPNDFFNHYIYACTFQWASLECLTNVTIAAKVALVTYIHCENG